MADGCYDIDGRCVNCGKFHPCNCEMNCEELEEAIEKQRNSSDEEFDLYESSHQYPDM